MADELLPVELLSLVPVVIGAVVLLFGRTVHVAVGVANIGINRADDLELASGVSHWLIVRSHLDPDFHLLEPRAEHWLWDGVGRIGSIGANSLC